MRPETPFRLVATPLLGVVPAASLALAQQAPASYNNGPAGVQAATPPR